MVKNMKTLQTHSKPFSGDKRPVSHTTPRQQRQHEAVSAVSTSRLNAREFKRFKTMVLWLQDRHSYRWLEKYTGRTHGWLQQVGAGNRKRVAPNHADLTNVSRLYEIVQADQALDAEALTLLLEVMEARARMDAALTKLISMARKRSGRAQETTDIKVKEQ